MSEEKPSKFDFTALVADLEQHGAILTREEIDRRTARDARQQRLERSRPPITPDDVRAIIADRLQETRALKIVRRWLHMGLANIQHEGRILRFMVLIGDPGLGKTVAGSWAIAQIGGYYVSAPELRRLQHSNDWRDQDTRRNLLGARLVVVDDLGTESGSGEAEEALWELVNARQVGGAFTLLTGNLTSAQFVKRYGDRTHERIEHQGTLVELTGDSLRRRA